MTVFLSDALEANLRKQIVAGLSDAAIKPMVLHALESLAGFIPMPEPSMVAKKN